MFWPHRRPLASAARAFISPPPLSRRGEALWEREGAGSGSQGAASSESAAGWATGVHGVASCARASVSRLGSEASSVSRSVCLSRVYSGSCYVGNHTDADYRHIHTHTHHTHRRYRCRADELIWQGRGCERGEGVQSVRYRSWNHTLTGIRGAR